MDLPTIYFVIVGLLGIALVLAGWSLYRTNHLAPPENMQHLRAAENSIEELFEGLNSLELAIENLAGKIPDPETMESIQAKQNSLGLEMSELQEFVSRNLKKMSTRAQRAEALNELMEQSKELDEESGQQPSQRGRYDPSSPNRRPRLVRRP